MKASKGSQEPTRGTGRAGAGRQQRGWESEGKKRSKVKRHIMGGGDACTLEQRIKLEPAVQGLHSGFQTWRRGERWGGTALPGGLEPPERGRPAAACSSGEGPVDGARAQLAIRPASRGEPALLPPPAATSLEVVELLQRSGWQAGAPCRPAAPLSALSCRTSCCRSYVASPPGGVAAAAPLPCLTLLLSAGAPPLRPNRRARRPGLPLPARLSSASKRCAAPAAAAAPGLGGCCSSGRACAELPADTQNKRCAAR